MTNSLVIRCVMLILVADQFSVPHRATENWTSEDQRGAATEGAAGTHR